MRRVRSLAFALLLLAATGSAKAEDGPAVMAANEAPRFVDASPPYAHARERLVEIQRRIQAALRYPPAARAREIEGTALVRFDIDNDGTPREIVVQHSSGLLSLDRAARAAVAAAAPLPWVYGRLEVPVVFALDRRR